MVMCWNGYGDDAGDGMMTTWYCDGDGMSIGVVMIWYCNCDGDGYVMAISMVTMLVMACLW